jgi:hypothetical protein
VVEEYGKLDGTEAVRGFTDNLTFTTSSSTETVSTATGDSYALKSNPNVTLTGRGSDETFIFNQGFGHATVTDFVPNSQPNANHDTIVFSPGAFSGFADLMQHATQSGSSTIIADPAGDKLVLQNVQKTQLTAADFHFAGPPNT